MKYLKFTGLIVLSLMIMSCSGGLGSSEDLSRTGGSGTATVVLKISQGSSSVQSAIGRAAPAGVSYVTINVTGPDMDPIVSTRDISEIEAGGGSVTIEVPTGPDRLIEVFAYTSAGALFYQGSVLVDLDGSGEPVSVPIVLDVVGLSADELLAVCIQLIGDDDISAARDICKDASDRYGPEDSNNADSARFFYAITRIFNVADDGDPDNGLNTLGDVLEAFNCTHPTSVHDEMLCPDILPGDSPTGVDLQNFFMNMARPEIEGIIATLEAISTSDPSRFNVLWTEPVDGTTVESDYGDVVFFWSLAKAGLGLILMQDAYDLDADIAFENNDDTGTAEDFLTAYPNYGSLTDTSNLGTAQGLFDDAIDGFISAVNWMDSETDPQADDFISLVDETPAEIQDALDDLDTAEQCLYGNCTIDDNDTVGDTSDDTILDYSGLFSPGIDFRALMPTVFGNDPTGFLPDPYMDGVFVQLDGFDPADLNTDGDGNSTADMFEEGFYYVYAGNDVSGDSSPNKSGIGNNPGAYGFNLIGAAHTYDGTISFPGAYDYYLVRSLWFAVHGTDYLIDSIYFTGADEYCCSQQVWHSGLNWGLLSADDNNGMWMYEDEYILMTAPAGANGIDVDGMPLP